jgi:hypothetical protein
MRGSEIDIAYVGNVTSERMVAAKDRVAFTVAAPAPRSRNARTAARERRAVREAVATVQELLDRFGPDELAGIAAGVRRALGPRPADPGRAAFVRELAGGRDYVDAERVALELAGQTRSLRLREEVLADALTAPHVAELLGTTRQTPHDRVRRGTLLGVVDRGALRFPPWQFDPEGPERAVAGLRETVRSLDMPPLAKISWFVRPSPYLEGRTPIQALRDGDRDRVLEAARGSGLP